MNSLDAIRRPHEGTLDELLALASEGDVARFWKSGVGLGRAGPGFGRDINFPSDPPGFIFLGRAISQIGAAMFGSPYGDYVRTPGGARACAEVWSGYEPVIVERESLPIDQTKAAPSLRRWAILLALVTNTRPVPTEQVAFSDTAWQRLVSVSKDASAISSKSKRRLELVHAWSAESFLSGAIGCFMLDAKSGNLQPVPSCAWSLSDVASRFVSCRIDPADLSRPVASRCPPAGWPMGETDEEWWVHPGATAWLFAAVEDLQQELANLPHGPRTTDVEVPATVAAETHFKKQLADVVANSLEAPQPKDSFWPAAKAAGVTKRGFNRAWASATENAPRWRAPGPRKRA